MEINVLIELQIYCRLEIFITWSGIGPDRYLNDCKIVRAQEDNNLPSSSKSLFIISFPCLK